MTNTIYGHSLNEDISDGRAVSLLEFAAWSALQKHDDKWLTAPLGVGFKNRGHCLSALACVPEAAGALSGMDACLLSKAFPRDLEELALIAPAMIRPDKRGETCVHHWARSGDVGVRQRVVAMLKTPLAHMALAPNKGGLSPLELAKANLSLMGSEGKKLELTINKAFAAYETKQMRLAMPAKVKKVPTSKPRRI